jgi:hypothetical protein
VLNHRMSLAMDITPPSQSAVAMLLPIVGAVFMSFLVIGLAMPVLPLHVHQGLGLGTFIVGLIVGSQFAASVVSRVWAGRHSDVRGAKHAVVAGLIISAEGSQPSRAGRLSTSPALCASNRCSRRKIHRTRPAAPSPSSRVRDPRGTRSHWGKPVAKEVFEKRGG